MISQSLYIAFKRAIGSENYETVAGKHLFKIAKENLGIDVSPLDKATDEYGCVESYEQIIYKAFGEGIGAGLSTIRAKVALENSRKFVRVFSLPRKGDTILCVTTEGNGKVSNGHIGIVGENECGQSEGMNVPIYSNKSANGEWSKHLTHDKWKQYFRDEGGYPIYYYRRIIN